MLYRNCAGSHLYGTEYEIWADFGPVGNTEKKNWAVKYSTFEGVFLSFHGQKKMKKLTFLKNIVATSLKSCLIFLL